MKRTLYEPQTLRDLAVQLDGCHPDDSIPDKGADALREAADEIERLRNALRDIERPPSGAWRDLYDRAQRIAREALYGL